jgi:hypothetical protein
VRDFVVLLLHLLATVARLAGPGSARSVVAESVLLKHHLLVLNRSRKRCPNLRLSDRMVAGVCAPLIRPGRLIRSAIVLKLWFANTPTAARRTRRRVRRRPVSRFRLSENANDVIAQTEVKTADGHQRSGELMTGDCSLPFENQSKSPTARDPVGLGNQCGGHAFRRVFARRCASTVVKARLSDTRAKRRALKWGRPIDNDQLIDHAWPVA